MTINGHVNRLLERDPGNKIVIQYYPQWSTGKLIDKSKQGNGKMITENQTAKQLTINPVKWQYNWQRGPIRN